MGALVYVLAGLFLYFFQNFIFFRPVKLSMDHRYNFTVPYREINLAINNDKNIAIVQFTVPAAVCKGVVLYFHGNKRNIERYAPYAGYFTKNNYEAWMIDYPGYGKSTGKRSESILYGDALELYKMARGRFAEDSIIIYGKSMGTGIAAQLASIRNCRRLILETPYYDFPSVINQYLPIYPLSLMLHYQFPTHDYLQKVVAPITIFHGTSDRIITHSNASKLIPLLTKKDEFVSIKGGSHNDLYEFADTGKKLDSLLK
jgi:uncharacterized protein